MKKRISIIGGGVAGMICAAFLDSSKFQVTLIEKNKALGRKFLVAGKGGFNLTHSESIEEMILKYEPPQLLKDVLMQFDNNSWRTWLKDIGIPTIVGSSGRVYPEEGIKPIDVVRKVSDHIMARDVEVKLNHKWNGWDDSGNLIIEDAAIESDIIIFSLGGASWSVTGSDGKWSKMFLEQGVRCVPHSPANCGFRIEWPAGIKERLGGKPLKNISICYKGRIATGEVVITDRGLEGNAIYMQSYALQKNLYKKKKVVIEIDLKPMVSIQDVMEILTIEKYKNLTAALRDGIKLEKEKIKLLKGLTSKDTFSDRYKVGRLIKSLPLEILSAYPIEGAISTLGGISKDEISTQYEVNKLKDTYCIGEMVDWWAPTGGYLIQGCVSMAVFLAKYLNDQVGQ